MATTLVSSGPARTFADLLDRLGGIPSDRVLLHPAPGTATEADVLALEARENRLAELVDGVLVEKPMGYRESLLAVALADHLRAFVRPRKLGLVSGSDGMMRLFSGLVRIPDVAFASWDRLPERRVPTQPIPSLVPDLAVEVLIQGNTAEEMERKVGEYFRAGVRLVWLVDLAARAVTVLTAPGSSRALAERDTLDGGQVLPGFALPLAKLFEEMDEQGNG